MHVRTDDRRRADSGRANTGPLAEAFHHESECVINHSRDEFLAIRFMRRQFETRAAEVAREVPLRCRELHQSND